MLDDTFRSLVVPTMASSDAIRAGLEGVSTASTLAAGEFATLSELQSAQEQVQRTLAAGNPFIWMDAVNEMSHDLGRALTINAVFVTASARASAPQGPKLLYALLGNHPG